MTATPFAVYECYDAAGALLYVGVTRNLKNRLVSHRHTSRWYADVSRVESTAFATSQEAAEAEHERIGTLNPRYNKERAGLSGIAWASRVGDKVAEVLFSLRLPIELHEELTRRARRNGRSLHGEVIFILERWVKTQEPQP